MNLKKTACGRLCQNKKVYAEPKPCNYIEAIIENESDLQCSRELNDVN